jgi:hypothetical protein
MSLVGGLSFRPMLLIAKIAKIADIVCLRALVVMARFGGTAP